MTDRQKEAIEYFKKRIDICMENANICDDNDFDEEATCLRKEQILTETVVNLIQTQQTEIEKKDKMIDKIQKEVRDHIGFENRLKRDNKEPDLFNQGRFYVANNINNILKGKVENGN